MSFASAFLIVALIAAITYAFRYVNAPVSWPRTIIKTIPLACLTPFAALSGAPSLIIAALALSAIGDAALSRQGDRWFLIGLTSFLFAHIAYIVLFLSQNTPMAGFFVMVTTAPFAIFAAGLVVGRLWSRLGALKVEVSVYAAVITAMLVSATALFSTHGLAIAGAVSFAVSDSFLAFEKFGSKPLRLHTQLIWWPYIFGQALILFAFI